VCLIDKDKLHFPLKIRKTQTGDSFYPLGLNGKKKVSDFMIDEKIPVNLKNRVLVLESANNIVWIIGHRIDDRYKVTSATREIIQLTYTHAS
jgi:tRNA(Ile)-lysidine synthase